MVLKRLNLVPKTLVRVELNLTETVNDDTNTCTFVSTEFFKNTFNSFYENTFDEICQELYLILELFTYDFYYCHYH